MGSTLLSDFVSSWTSRQCTDWIRSWRLDYGEDSWPLSKESIVYSLLFTALASVSFLVYFLNQREYDKLRQELQKVQTELDALRQRQSPRTVRIFMDGAFDLMHFGHMNAFRLAKSLGTHLIVGLNSDESIERCKGAAPLLTEDERRTMVQACQFVDEIVSNVPYVMNREYLEEAIEKYRIDYVIHGDDPCIVDGKDVYASAKEAGKYRSIPRTEGVSTTDIVGRMLLLTSPDQQLLENVSLGQKSKFLTTSRLLRLFSQDIRAPPKGSRIIYIDGAWDLLHPGHVNILQRASEV